jgi:hypothetical protein
VRRVSAFSSPSPPLPSLSCPRLLLFSSPELTQCPSPDVDNSVLDIFDIGQGGWTRQSVSGASVGSRINHCAVRASAKVDGIQLHHIFVYGGQQLNQSDRDSYVLFTCTTFRLLR